MHRYNLFGTPAKSRGFQMSKKPGKFLSKLAGFVSLRHFRCTLSQVIFRRINGRNQKLFDFNTLFKNSFILEIPTLNQ